MTDIILKWVLPFLLLCVCIEACKRAAQVNDEEAHATDVRPSIETPDWAKNASIYEVNIRQYTEEGTFVAFQEHLPRLQEMGIKILWFMPIFPISETKRKGGLGSYYAVSDFRSTNPEFGSLDDFRRLLTDVHDRGMYLILDWVPNHTGWDHTWINTNPEFYSKDSLGQITDPLNPETGESWGWTDVADLNFANAEMRATMLDDMLYWTNDVGVDGFRMDVAHGVPHDFWDQVDSTLGAQGKPLFMLAESEIPYHRNSGVFDMTYAWGLHHLLNDIAQGKEDASKIDTLLADERSTFNQGYHMFFTSNHDENSWAGTVFERMGDAHLPLAVLCATLPGMPLIYGGQEEPLQKRLSFFEKDTILWKDFAYVPFYTTLLREKLENEALWNGAGGGEIEKIITSEHIFAFRRTKNDDSIVVILNLSDQIQQAEMSINLEGYTDVFSGVDVSYPRDQSLALDPWSYQVMSKRD